MSSPQFWQQGKGIGNRQSHIPPIDHGENTFGQSSESCAKGLACQMHVLFSPTISNRAAARASCE
jgi:hypothetical protein